MTRFFWYQIGFKDITNFGPMFTISVWFCANFRIHNHQKSRWSLTFPLVSIWEDERGDDTPIGLCLCLGRDTGGIGGVKEGFDSWRKGKEVVNQRSQNRRHHAWYMGLLVIRKTASPPPDVMSWPGLCFIKQPNHNTIKPALVTTCLQRPHFLFPLKMVSH